VELPEPPMYLAPPPCWSKSAISLLIRDLQPDGDGQTNKQTNKQTHVRRVAVTVATGSRPERPAAWPRGFGRCSGRCGGPRSTGPGPSPPRPPRTPSEAEGRGGVTVNLGMRSLPVHRLQKTRWRRTRSKTRGFKTTTSGPRVGLG